MLENKSGNISETRKDRGKVTTGAYKNSPTLFRMLPFPTKTFPRLEGAQNSNRYYLRNL